jgi:hypothetical protein
MQVEIELPTPHEKQQYLLDHRKRFNVLKCGRRFGKTELCQELILEAFENGWYVGYFSPTYKDLYEVWKTTLNNFHSIIVNKSETVKQCVFVNGSKVDFWSMEDPNSGRGRKYHRAIMDECEKAGKFEDAWQQAIAPTLTDFGGDAYFLSTPQFGQTYFKKLCKFQERDPEHWATFVYSTYDNPFIDRGEIELMRAVIDPLVFRCEYMAEDVDGRSPSPFAYQWDADHHISDRAVFNEGKRIIMSIDFNLQPFACVFSHIWEDADGVHDHTFDEIEIAQGSIQAMADEIKMRYKAHLHKFEITGDYMGNRGDISQRDNASLYLQLCKELGISKHQLKLSPNPTHENSKADVNYVLWKAKSEKKCEFIINPTCKGSIFDFQSVQWDNLKQQIVKKDRSNKDQQADRLDCHRYKINHYWKKYILR